jgi:hypothetical protein
MRNQTAFRHPGLRVRRLERRFGHPRRGMGLLNALEDGYRPVHKRALICSVPPCAISREMSSMSSGMGSSSLPVRRQTAAVCSGPERVVDCSGKGMLAARVDG